MENKGLIIAIAILCGLSFIFATATLFDKDITTSDVDNSIAKALAEFELTIPTAEEIASKITIPEIVIPEIENADNELLNEFLEDKFYAEYNLIEDAAKDIAKEELEEKDYRVVERHLKSILAEGLILDEDSLDVKIEETDVEVTKLGLKEDEDKCATVAYELEVEYDFTDSERFIDSAERILNVEYTVCFTEGEFDDEEVDFVFK